MAETYIHWDKAALEDLLNTPEGPVGVFLEDMADRMTAVAAAAAPVQTPRTFSRGKKYSTSYMPWSGGYTKSHVKPHIGYTRTGTLFSGVNAPYGPTLFLQKPARQMHHSYPFLTTALDSASI